MHLLHITGIYARDHTTSIFSLVTGTILNNLSRNLLVLIVSKEEQLILNNRAAQGETIDGLTVFSSRTEILTVNLITAHVLVAEISIGSTLEGICTRLSNSINATTNEVSLTNIVRSNNYLNFLNSIQ